MCIFDSLVFKIVLSHHFHRCICWTVVSAVFPMSAEEALLSFSFGEAEVPLVFKKCLLLCQKLLETMQPCLSANYLAAWKRGKWSKTKQTCSRSDKDLSLELCLPWVLLSAEDFIFCLWCVWCVPSFSVHFKENLFETCWSLQTFFWCSLSFHLGFVVILFPSLGFYFSVTTNKKFSSASLLGRQYFCIVIR